MYTWPLPHSPTLAPVWGPSACKQAAEAAGLDRGEKKERIASAPLRRPDSHALATGASIELHLSIHSLQNVSRVTLHCQSRSSQLPG